MTQGNEQNDPDKNLSGWIKNNTISSFTGSGVCNAEWYTGIDGAGARKTNINHSYTNNSLGVGMDYYICGGDGPDPDAGVGDEALAGAIGGVYGAGYGALVGLMGQDQDTHNAKCAALTKEEWDQIYVNCKDSRLGYDHCSNVIRDGLGWNDDNFNSDVDAFSDSHNGTFNPVNCRWSEADDGSGFWDAGDEFNEGTDKCNATLAAGSYGKLRHKEATLSTLGAGPDGLPKLSPTNNSTMSLPTDVAKAYEIVGSDFRDTNADGEAPPPCPPGTGYADGMISYQCVADGDADGSNQEFSDGTQLPACGKAYPDGDTLDDRTDSIRFCKRNWNDWLPENLMNCCITDKSLRWNEVVGSKGRAECPSEYCLTKVPFTDADTAAASSCTNPIVEGDQQFCYQLSDSCNEIFKDQCTIDIFLNKPPVGETPERKKYDQCIHWAKIMPSEFNELAEELCHPKPWLDIVKRTVSPTLLLDDIMEAGAGGGSSKVTKLVDIFNDPMCRNWLLDNLNTEYQTTGETVLDTIKETCATVVGENGTDENGESVWEKKRHYDDLDFCPCYLPDEYYDYWKRVNLFSDDGVVTNIQKNYHLQPMCYKGDCIQSLFYNDTSLDSCPRAIEVCVNQIKGGISYADNNTRIVRPSMESIQVCNFSSTYGTDDGSTVTVDGQTVDDETINDYLGAVDDLVGSEISDINHLLLPSSFSREDSNTFISDNLPFIGIIFVVSIVMVVILLLIGGKKGNSIMPMPIPMPMPMSVN